VLATARMSVEYLHNVRTRKRAPGEGMEKKRE